VVSVTKLAAADPLEATYYGDGKNLTNTEE